MWSDICEILLISFSSKMFGNQIHGNYTNNLISNDPRSNLEVSQWNKTQCAFSTWMKNFMKPAMFFLTCPLSKLSPAGRATINLPFPAT